MTIYKKKHVNNFELVKNHLNLAFYFNCSSFTYIAKHCKRKRCCFKYRYHCGKDNYIEALTYPNSIKLKQDDCEYSARDVQCPVYQGKLTVYRNQMNY